MRRKLLLLMITTLMPLLIEMWRKRRDQRAAEPARVVPRTVEA